MGWRDLVDQVGRYMGLLVFTNRGGSGGRGARFFVTDVWRGCVG